MLAAILVESADEAGPQEPPSQQVMDAVVEMKQRNPTWECPRIAQQITLAFGITSAGCRLTDSGAVVPTRRRAA